MLANHEAGNVLKENEWNPALATQFDKVCTLESRFRVKHAVIGDNPNQSSGKFREGTEQCCAIERFKFIKIAAIYDTADNFSHIVGFAGIRWDDAVKFVCRIERIDGWVTRWQNGRGTEVCNDPPRDGQCMVIIVSQVIGDARVLCVKLRPAKVFRADRLTCCGFNQGRPPEKNSPLVSDDYRFIRHRGHIGTAGCAGTHHNSNLRDASSRHIGLVKKTPAKVISIGEHLVLQWQKGTPGIHQINTRQAISLGYLLCAKMFLDGDRVIGSAFDGGIVGNNDALAP